MKERISPMQFVIACVLGGFIGMYPAIKASGSYELSQMAFGVMLLMAMLCGLNILLYDE